MLIIEDDVEIGNDCQIGPHAVLYNGARIAEIELKFINALQLRIEPQDLKFGNESTYFYVGDDTVIHEFVTFAQGYQGNRFFKDWKKLFIDGLFSRGSRLYYR
ncbi:MAG: hypothetical protein MZV64_65695 [Ignavibacteriales bacterium]|nr:hypothetical protein [Ignavibacteriales bacterium]